VQKCRAKHTKKSQISETPEQRTGYEIVPRWIDATGRTRTWTLLSPAGDRIADTTTKQGANNLVYLLSRARGIEWNL